MFTTKDPLEALKTASRSPPRPQKQPQVAQRIPDGRPRAPKGPPEEYNNNDHDLNFSYEYNDNDHDLNVSYEHYDYYYDLIARRRWCLMN